MRWLPLFLSLAALPFGSSAAKKPAVERFERYYSKALSSTPVKLTDATYKELTSTPRDFTAVVLLTALDARYGCQLCHEFQPEWEILAKSWIKGDKKGLSRTVFSTLDFSDGRDTFMSLNLQTAPVLLLFQPTTGPHAVTSVEAIRYDFTSGPQSAEQVRNWVARHLSGRPQPTVKRPVNYVLWLVTSVSLLGIVGLITKAWPYIVPFVQSRNTWAAISLIGILMFTSGHMFNQIRKVPYVTGDGKGGISYFAAGFQNQVALETQIIAMLYGALSFGAIALIVKAPRIVDPKRQSFAVLFFAVAIFLVYSFLMSVFRIKNGGYPFRLPPFL